MASSMVYDGHTIPGRQGARMTNSDPFAGLLLGPAINNQWVDTVDGQVKRVSEWQQELKPRVTVKKHESILDNIVKNEMSLQEHLQAGEIKLQNHCKRKQQQLLDHPTDGSQ